MIIYRILNTINQKSYIGQSINKFNVRYKGGQWWKYTHNIILKNSINKYGLGNFIFEILEDNVSSMEDLNKLEIFYSNKYNSYRPHGYNIRGCGNNRFVDDELKKHLSSFRLGKDYKPKNKMSKYKGVYWRESKRSWMCRFHNSIIHKDKYVDSEIDAATMYDKVSLYLIGEDCYLNFEERREEYLESDLEYFYNEFFIRDKTKRNDGYFKDDSELISKIKPLLGKMSINKIAIEIGSTARKVGWCIKKNNLT